MPKRARKQSTEFSAQYKASVADGQSKVPKYDNGAGSNEKEEVC